jgi:putative nucleotidyltransferase with HDIG domain
MTRSPNQIWLRLATEALHRVAISCRDTLVWTHGHPRSIAARRAAIEALRNYYALPDEPPLLSFVIEAGRILFHSVPVLEAGVATRAWVRSLEASGILRVDFHPTMEPSDFEELAAVTNPMAPRALGPGSAADGGSEESVASTRASGALRIFRREDADSLPQFPLGLQRAPADPDSSWKDVRVSRSGLQGVIESSRVLYRELEAGRSLELSILDAAAADAVALTRRVSFGSGVIPLGSYFDDFTFHHSVNVCLLASQVVAQWSNDDRMLQTVALAALLHDVGKSRVPREILHKVGALSPLERASMQEHSVLGAEILLSYDAIDLECITIAFTHHMHSAAGSYPATRRPIPLGAVHRLLGVVDIYEALTARRPYKEGMSSKRAFEVMFGMPGLSDRLPLVELLYTHVGAYPVGTIVELPSGERGIVVEHRPSAPDRPRIRLIGRANGNTAAPGEEVELSAERKDLDPRSCRPIVCGDDDDPLSVAAETTGGPCELFGENLLEDGVLMHREG